MNPYSVFEGGARVCGAYVQTYVIFQKKKRERPPIYTYTDLRDRELYAYATIPYLYVARTVRYISGTVCLPDMRLVRRVPV